MGWRVVASCYQLEFCLFSRRVIIRMGKVQTGGLGGLLVSEATPETCPVCNVLDGIYDDFSRRV